jgi:hypothetical protein
MNVPLEHIPLISQPQTAFASHLPQITEKLGISVVVVVDVVVEDEVVDVVVEDEVVDVVVEDEVVDVVVEDEVVGVGVGVGVGVPVVVVVVVEVVHW